MTQPSTTTQRPDDIRAARSILDDGCRLLNDIHAARSILDGIPNVVRDEWKARAGVLGTIAQVDGVLKNLSDKVRDAVTQDAMAARGWVMPPSCESRAKKKEPSKRANARRAPQ